MRFGTMSIAAFALTGTVSMPVFAAPPAASPDATHQQEDSKTSVSAAPAFVLPVGNLSNVAGVGLGALVGVQRPVAKQLDVTGRAGFVYHFSKDIFGVSYGISEVPILGGVRYMFVPASDGGLYGAAELGLSLVFSRVSASNLATPFGQAASAGASSSDLRLSTGLGAGYQLDKLDVRASLYCLDLGHLGDTMSLMATVGYTFASL